MDARGGDKRSPPGTEGSGRGIGDGGGVHRLPSEDPHDMPSPRPRPGTGPSPRPSPGHGPGPGPRPSPGGPPGVRGGRDSDSDREADAPGTPAFSPELAVEETMSVCYCLANALQVRPIQPLSSPYL